MLGEDAALQRIALLASHLRHVERVSLCCLIRRLLQLAPVDQLHVRNGYSSGFAGVLVLEAAPQSGQHGREVIIERVSCGGFPIWRWWPGTAARGHL
jgi:hypothetical protein